MSSITANYSAAPSYSSNVGLAARNLLAALFAAKPVAAAAPAAVGTASVRDEDVPQYLPQTGMVYSIFSARGR